MQKNVILTIRSDGNQRNAGSGKLFDQPEIVAAVFRQLIKTADTADIFIPAFHHLIYRFGPGVFF